MARKRTPGLIKRGETWHIDKQIKGYGRLCESTGHSDYDKANLYLATRLTQIQTALASGRPTILWREAATKYLLDHKDKASIADDGRHLKALDPYIGDRTLDDVHDGSLSGFISDRRVAGIRTASINRALAVVRRILNLAARSWRLPSGKPWLETAPLITMQKPPQGRSDSRMPYPLDWDEQDRLFGHLHERLARMALFGVNTGCRESEICGLRWEWEFRTDIPDLRGRVFLIPGDVELVTGGGIKNRENKLIVLNDVAHAVVERCRGDHPDYVFVREDGRPIIRMHTTAWKFAWIRAGLPDNGKFLKGPHNLRHTCATRLRAAGVPVETRKAILGHTNGDVTTRYSAAGIVELLEAVNRLNPVSRKNPALTLVKLTA